MAFSSGFDCKMWLIQGNFMKWFSLFFTNLLLLYSGCFFCPFSYHSPSLRPSVIHIIGPLRGKKGDKQTYLSSAGYPWLKCYSS